MTAPATALRCRVSRHREQQVRRRGRLRSNRLVCALSAISSLRTRGRPRRCGDWRSLLEPRQCTRRAEIVHSAELSFWFTAEAARLRPTHGYKPVVTVWETVSLMATLPNAGHG